MNEKILIEIRQGVGGLESVYFVKDLVRMYTKFFEKKKIKYDIIHNSSYKEVIIRFENNKYYDNFINESGIHRVQRIPKTESQGKIHTSTCSVYVSKEKYFQKTLINCKEIKIEICKSSGAGGQHVNSTNSAVKALHLPTKIFVECSDERSQILNKNKAILLLNIKLSKMKEFNYNNNLNENRKSVVADTSRSKKIRTYNFSNNKIINHSTKKNFSQLEKILDGNLELIFND